MCTFSLLLLNAIFNKHLHNIQAKHENPRHTTEMILYVLSPNQLPDQRHEAGREMQITAVL